MTRTPSITPCKSSTSNVAWFLLKLIRDWAFQLNIASFLNRSVIDEKIASVCPYCGAGCKLNLVVENNRIIRAEAADGVTNQGTLCLKGFYGWDFLNDTRLLTPA